MAHLHSGHSWLPGHDVPDQRLLCIRQHSFHATALNAYPIPRPHEQLGLHQPSSYLPPGAETKKEPVVIS